MATGRFTSEDTHWSVGNMIYGDSQTGIPNISAILQSGNLFVYCGSNPIIRMDISGFEWGYIRDFANDLSMIFGGSPRYDFGYGGVRITTGGGAFFKSGMIYFDGFAELKYNGGRHFTTQQVARNQNGRLYLARTDFYRAMGVKAAQSERRFSVTTTENNIKSLAIGALTTYATKGLGTWTAFGIGAISAAIDDAYSFTPGNYKVIYTVAEVYDSSSGLYTSILTYEYYKQGYDGGGNEVWTIERSYTVYNGQSGQAMVQ